MLDCKQSHIASEATPIGSADAHPTTAARTAYKTTNLTAILMLHPNTPIESIITTSLTAHQQMIDTHYGGYCRFESMRDSSSPPGTRGLLTRGYPHDSSTRGYLVRVMAGGPQ